MSVYRPSQRHRSYVYDFHFRGRRYHGPTYQTTKSAAALVEAKRKLETAGAGRRDHAGLPRGHATFTAWAATTLAYQSKFIKRPAILERTLRMIWRFGARCRPSRSGRAAVDRLELARGHITIFASAIPIVDPSWVGPLREMDGGAADRWRRRATVI